MTLKWVWGPLIIHICLFWQTRLIFCLTYKGSSLSRCLMLNGQKIISPHDDWTFCLNPSKVEMLIQSSWPVKINLQEFTEFEGLGLDTGVFGNSDGKRAKVGSPVSTGMAETGITVGGLCVGVRIKPENLLHVFPWEMKMPSQPSLLITVFPPSSTTSFAIKVI